MSSDDFQCQKEPIRPIDRFVFLDWIRAISVLLVVYDHNFAIFSDRHSATFGIVSFLRRYVTGPLGIIQDFGWLGVCLFFLTSGFIISHVALKESTSEFIVKRIFRIFPLLIFIIGFEAFRRISLGQDIAWRDILSNCLLLNYVSVQGVNLVGVSWTLAIELLFYIMTALTISVKSAHFWIIFNLLTVFFVTLSCRTFGDSFFIFSASLSYVSVIILGQIIYFSLVANVLIFRYAMLYALISYFIFNMAIHDIHKQFIPVENSYLISLLYGILIFIICTLMRDRFSHNRKVSALSLLSYSLYLTHGTIGLMAAEIFERNFGLAGAVLGGLLSTLASSLLLHRILEAPLNRLGARTALRMRSV